MTNAQRIEPALVRTVDAAGVVTLRLIGYTWSCVITHEGHHGFSVDAFVHDGQLSRYSGFATYYKTYKGATNAALLWLAKRLAGSNTMHRSTFPIVTDPSPEQATAND